MPRSVNRSDQQKEAGPSGRARRVQRPRRDPHRLVRELMAARGMADAHLDRLPRRWVRLGRVALIHLPPELRMWARQLGGAYAHALGVETVGELEGIHGELRIPRLRLYYGTRTTTEVREHGLRYRLDLARVMWSPGNVGWRAGTDETGDPRVARLYHVEPSPTTIVDLFTGVGYFALPLARQHPGARVVAVEKNPEAHAFLVENIALNGLDNVHALEGDCRHLPDNLEGSGALLEGGAQLVHMGYVGGTASYLPTALRLISPEGGVVLYHESYPNRQLGRLRRSQWRDDEAPGPLALELEVAVRAAGRQLVGLKVARVKSYAPGVSHLVARLEVR